MARRRNTFVSPIDPSMHFILFLVMALLLIVVVAAVMMQTGKNARALFICPRVTQTQPTGKIRTCPKPYSVKIIQDDNKCPLPQCILAK